MSILQAAAEKINASFEVFNAPQLRDVKSQIKGRFTVICPVTKRADELWLKITLVANGSGDFIEYVSFYSWLLSLADQELGIEGSCELIYTEIEKICKPTLLKVKVQTGYKVINQIATRKNTHKYLKKR